MQISPVTYPTTHHLATSLGLGQPSRMANLPPTEQVKAAAGQFEAILLRQFLQESVGSMMGGESGGPTGNVYGYLLTDTLASQLSAGGGLGLSKILQHQLTPRSSVDGATITPLKGHS